MLNFLNLNFANGGTQIIHYATDDFCYIPLVLDY